MNRVSEPRSAPQFTRNLGPDLERRFPLRGFRLCKYLLWESQQLPMSTLFVLGVTGKRLRSLFEPQCLLICFRRVHRWYVKNNKVKVRMTLEDNRFSLRRLSESISATTFESSCQIREKLQGS
jgi:hypothetical protein